MQDSLDSTWFPQFKSIGAAGAEEFFHGDETYRTKQRELFLNGKIRNPSLDYPELSVEKLKERDRKTDQLLYKIDVEETNDLVKQMYISRLEEKRTETALLLASANKDMTNFQMMNERLYGSMNTDIFYKALAFTLRQIDENQIDSTDLKKLLPQIPHNSSSDLIPSFDSATILVQLKQQFHELLNISEEKDMYIAADIKDAFERGLQTLCIQGWRVEVRHGGVVSVNHEKKTVYIPRTRALGHQELKGLMVHELGTHVVRGVHGEQSGLSLLSLGLDHYLSAEEGIATFREGVVAGTVDFAKWIARHLAIGMALGIDGKPKDFRDVYEFLEQYYLFQQRLGRSSKQDPLEEAWTTTVRTFRGTDCSTPGVCFTKDKVYLEGYISICQLVSKDPQSMSHWNIGKYDPTNTQHQRIVDYLLKNRT